MFFLSLGSKFLCLEILCYFSNDHGLLEPCLSEYYKSDTWARDGFANLDMIVHVETSFGDIFFVFLSFLLDCPLSLLDLQDGVQIFSRSFVL